jgi:hypothetical protein
MGQPKRPKPTFLKNIKKGKKMEESHRSGLCFLIALGGCDGFPKGRLVSQA